MARRKGAAEAVSVLKRRRGAAGDEKRQLPGIYGALIASRYLPGQKAAPGKGRTVQMERKEKGSDSRRGL